MALTRVLATMTSFAHGALGSVLRTVQEKLKERVSVLDFGADPTGATDSTAAFDKAQTYVAALGGGEIAVPIGTYMLNNFNIRYEGVVFRGVGSVFMYAKVASCVKLVPAPGAKYVVRLMGTRTGVTINAAEGSGLKNLQVLEPNSGTTEYGIFIDSGGTDIDSVQVSGFQYGVVLADQANQNSFRKMNIILNTKVGFAVTESQGKAYLHPGVTGITDISNTTFFMDKCNIRQNGFGIVLRSVVGANFKNTVSESNDQAGMYVYRTNVSSVREITFEGLWLENNYQNYTSGSTTYSIAGNRMLLASAGTPIAWTSAYQAGYQMVIDSQTHYGGGCDTLDFINAKINCATAAQKGILILSGFKINMHRPWFGGTGDTPNLVRVTSDAEAVHWYDPLVGNNPYAVLTCLTDNFGANSGSRGLYYKSGTSFGTAELGGQYPILGVTGGPLHILAMDPNDPRRADPRVLDEYYEMGTALVGSMPWRTGSATPFTVSNEKNSVTKIGRLVFGQFKGTLTVNTATTGTDKLYLGDYLPYQCLDIDHIVGGAYVEPAGGSATVLNGGVCQLRMPSLASLFGLQDVFGALAVGNVFNYRVWFFYITKT